MKKIFYKPSEINAVRINIVVCAFKHLQHSSA